MDDLAGISLHCDVEMGHFCIIVVCSTYLFIERESMRYISLLVLAVLLTGCGQQERAKQMVYQYTDNCHDDSIEFNMIQEGTVKTITITCQVKYKSKITIEKK